MDKDKKVCGKPTSKSLPCKASCLAGLDTCYHHLSIEEKEKRKAEKASNGSSKSSKNKSEYNSTSKSKLVDMIKNKDIQIETLTNLIVKMGISQKHEQIVV